LQGSHQLAGQLLSAKVANFNQWFGSRKNIKSMILGSGGSTGILQGAISGSGPHIAKGSWVYGCFLKWWVKPQQTHGVFLLKMIILGCEMGVKSTILGNPHIGNKKSNFGDGSCPSKDAGAARSFGK